MPNQHVVKRNNGGWSVRGEGNSKATRNVDTQQEAIVIARRIAINQKSEVFIHAANGKFRDKDSYGNDPTPPKG
ncbi:MAG: DUF2188 domain-containing protein [Clostridia bacterium]